MLDCREKFLQEVQRDMIGLVNNDIMERIVDNITVKLNNYEISERCTDLVIPDDKNRTILKQYLACLTIGGKSKNTISQYGRMIERMSNIIGKPFTEYMVSDVRYYLACEKQRGLANSTLENSRSYISSFFKWLSVEGFISKNNI